MIIKTIILISAIILLLFLCYYLYQKAKGKQLNTIIRFKKFIAGNIRSITLTISILILFLFFRPAILAYFNDITYEYENVDNDSLTNQLSSFTSIKLKTRRAFVPNEKIKIEFTLTYIDTAKSNRLINAQPYILFFNSKTHIDDPDFEYWEEKFRNSSLAMGVQGKKKNEADFERLHFANFKKAGKIRLFKTPNLSEYTGYGIITYDAPGQFGFALFTGNNELKALHGDVIQIGTTSELFNIRMAEIVLFLTIFNLLLFFYAELRKQKK